MRVSQAPQYAGHGVAEGEAGHSLLRKNLVENNAPTWFRHPTTAATNAQM
jgi:hypothetical protein